MANEIVNGKQVFNAVKEFGGDIQKAYENTNGLFRAYIDELLVRADTTDVETVGELVHWIYRFTAGIGALNDAIDAYVPDLEARTKIAEYFRSNTEFSNIRFGFEPVDTPNIPTPEEYTKSPDDVDDSAPVDVDYEEVKD